MTFSEEKFNRLNEKRQKIVVTFHQLKALNPKAKRYNLVRQTAVATAHKLDPVNKNSSFVMKVIREWEKAL